MSDFASHLLGERAETRHRPIDKLPELLAVDLVVAMHPQLDLLPGAAEVPALHPRLGAVERQLGHVVQRLQFELFDQLLPIERIPRRAELHLQQPLLAGDGVEEPAVRFLRRTNLDHGPRSLQSVSANKSDCSWMRSTTSARMRPSQRQGLPVRPTRSTVCQRRPSVCQGIRASPPISVMSRSPSCEAVSAAKSNGFRSTSGPAASTGAKAAAVWETRKAEGGGRRAETEVRHADCRIRISSTPLLVPPSAFRPPPFRLPPRPSPLHHVFRRARRNHVAALLARLGPQVDHPVGRLDHVEIVLDHHDGVAQVDQPVEHVQQLGQIVEVQAGRRLVEQIERPAGVGPGKLGGQFDPLGLAAGERRGRLAEREIVQPHVAERLQRPANLGNVLEQLDRLAARHVQHVGDRPAVIADGQRLGVVAPAAAGVALDPHVGQEVHLDAELPVAFAFLAPPAGHVEAEPPRRVAAELRLGQLGVERADQVEDAGERGRIRGRRLSQRLLIDADHLVDQLHAADGVVGAGRRSSRGAASGPATRTARPRPASSCRCR